MLLEDLPILLVFAMIIVVIATASSTNMAANVVSPSNDFSDLRAAPDLVPHRRPDHRRDPRRLVPLAARTRTSARTPPRGSSATAACWRRSSRSTLVRLLAAADARGSTVEELLTATGRGGAALVLQRASTCARAPTPSRPACARCRRASCNAATTEGGVVADPNFLDQLYRYGVFVAFGISAVAYVAMTRQQVAAPAPAET